VAYLTIRIKGEDGYTQRDLEGDRVVIGRNEEADCIIKDTNISRQHCAFVREDGTWSIEDLGSANGTRLNREKISGRQQLNERDIVKLGHARLTFHASSRPEHKREGIELDANALGGNLARSRQVSIDDPAEATTCDHCGSWVSIAHRLAGDRMQCPACNRSFSVPELTF